MQLKYNATGPKLTSPLPINKLKDSEMKSYPFLSANSYERIFGSTETRRPRPKHLNISQARTEKPRKSSKPLPGNLYLYINCLNLIMILVSPITGHVIGTGGTQVVDIPVRAGMVIWL